MTRLLIAGAILYVGYRIARKIAGDVPDNVDPLLLPPPDYREALRQQSAALGVDPQR